MALNYESAQLIQDELPYLSAQKYKAIINKDE